jgi:hypothetical protein
MTTNETVDIRPLAVDELDQASGGALAMIIALGIGAAAGVIAGILTSGKPLGRILEQTANDLRNM